MHRRLELWAGIGGAVVGGLGLADLLFGPWYRSGSGSASMVQVGGMGPTGVVFFALVAAALLGATAGAYVHSRRGSRVGLALLWISAAFVAIVSVFSMGFRALLLPGAVLIVAAAVMGSLHEEQGRRIGAEK